MENVIVGIYPQAFPCAASSSCVITDDAKGGQPKRKVLYRSFQGRKHISGGKVSHFLKRLSRANNQVLNTSPGERHLARVGRYVIINRAT